MRKWYIMFYIIEYLATWTEGNTVSDGICFSKRGWESLRFTWSARRSKVWWQRPERCKANSCRNWYRYPTHFNTIATFLHLIFLQKILIETLYPLFIIVTHASGSAHLRLANTDILVGVKGNIANIILYYLFRSK